MWRINLPRKNRVEVRRPSVVISQARNRLIVTAVKKKKKKKCLDFIRKVGLASCRCLWGEARRLSPRPGLRQGGEEGLQACGRERGGAGHFWEEDVITAEAPDESQMRGLGRAGRRGRTSQS